MIKHSGEEGGCATCHGSRHRSRPDVAKAELPDPETCSKPVSYAYAFPDLITIGDYPTPMELRLLEMFLDHRRFTIQGTFHGNPLHAFDSGWPALCVDLTESESMAEELRMGHRLARK